MCAPPSWQQRRWACLPHLVILDRKLGLPQSEHLLYWQLVFPTLECLDGLAVCLDGLVGGLQCSQPDFHLSAELEYWNPSGLSFFLLGYQLSRMQAMLVPGLQDKLSCRRKVTFSFSPRDLPFWTIRGLLEHILNLSVRWLNPNIKRVFPSF